MLIFVDLLVWAKRVRYFRNRLMQNDMCITENVAGLTMGWKEGANPEFRVCFLFKHPLGRRRTPEACALTNARGGAMLKM